MKIKISKDGPYLVSGSIPLFEKRIVPNGRGYLYKQERTLPQAAEYALCRCGKSKNAPFCDGAHCRKGFDGTETADKSAFADRIDVLEGPTLNLQDDGRCAFARFCHREKGTVWELVRASDCAENREEAILAAVECPSGRLAVTDKAGQPIEPTLEPSITIIQDPQRDCSGGIFVQGNIPIESADGQLYEVRNRVALCRCGESDNKPFCDATHIAVGFSDEY